MFTDDTADNLCALYEENFEELGDYSKALFTGLCENAELLDSKITEFASGWRLARIPKINVAILRVAIYEVMFVDDVPASVAVNEAVELAKKYSGTDDASFINGILGSLVRELD